MNFAKRLRFGLALAPLVLAAPAFADKTYTLYSNQDWQVEGIQSDDGTYACLAEVSAPGESFSLWVFPDQSIRLQFYSEDWSFGDNDSADLQVAIDRRTPWSLTGANLTQNSVLFDLPDQKESVDFVVEVAKGSTLHLRDKSGNGVKDYSLAGSSASISKLIDCGDAISSSGSSNSKNPFN